jgi:hypothetical protein
MPVHTDAQDLIARPGPLQQLVNEYGSQLIKAEDDAEKKADAGNEPTAKKEGKTHMLDEDRETGYIPPSTYFFWLRGMGSPFVVGLVFTGYVISQGIQVALVYWLGSWQSKRYPGLSQAAYQGIYAGIAVAYAIMAFICNSAFIWRNIKGSIKISLEAVRHIMGAPTSFLDRTPVSYIQDQRP